MNKKILLFFIFFIALQSCGYTPMYSSSTKTSFNFNQINFEGDREINIYINNQLKRYLNPNSKENVILDITTNYLKNSVSKDSTGKTTKYTISVEAIVNIKKNNLIKNIIIEENFMMENFNNELDEKKYEDSIKKNYSNLFINKLILQLINF